MDGFEPSSEVVDQGPDGSLPPGQQVGTAEAPVPGDPLLVEPACDPALPLGGQDRVAVPGVADLARPVGIAVCPGDASGAEGVVMGTRRIEDQPALEPVDHAGEGLGLVVGRMAEGRDLARQDTNIVALGEAPLDQVGEPRAGHGGVHARQVAALALQRPVP
ncbi:hypothetical protein L6R53_02955 [Myxococcota bacterium]|nr:hypothetical protein [Myxococcota bacterium]